MKELIGPLAMSVAFVVLVATPRRSGWSGASAVSFSAVARWPWVLIAVMALFTLTHCGCAARVRHAYDGPERQPQEVAMLVGSKHGLYLLFYNRVIFIVPESVDDYPVEPDAVEWALLPGPHSVRTAYYMNRHFALGGAFFVYRHPPRRQAVTFSAEAGRRYRVDGHVIDQMEGVREYCAWIEDEETGEVVGGAKDCGKKGGDQPTPDTPALAPAASSYSLRSNAP